MTYMGEEWGQKDEEFEKFITLPSNLTSCSLEMVINPPLNPESNFDLQKIVDHKWTLMHPKDMVATAKDYRAFIQSSEGEFSIAKATYVKSKSGWFSCRSACYLAAGNPVIAQETGWSEYIPAGSGLLAFHDMDSAIASLEAVNANKSAHGKAAVSVAKEFFDSDIVLTDLLNKLN